MLFLSKICTLCKTARSRASCKELDTFCRKTKLVDNITVRGSAVGWGRGKAPRHQPPGRPGLGQRWLCWCWVPAAARPHPACALQALLEKEPTDSLRTAFRQRAMETITILRYLPSPCFGQHIPRAMSWWP